MPFDIELMQADWRAPPPHYLMVVESVVRANGGRVAAHGIVQLPDGGQFSFESDRFWPKRLTPEVCRIIFDVALHTNNYVNTAGSEVVPLKIKGTTIQIPELGPPYVISDPVALCTRLEARLARWNSEMSRMRAEGTIDTNDLPLEPPPDPGTEPRLPDDPSGLAAACETGLRKMSTDLRWPLTRHVVTRNPKWGVVWRADVAPQRQASTWLRETCWHAPGGGISLSSRPLEMFDKSQNIKPLPAK
jgi:hypothetical protein